MESKGDEKADVSSYGSTYLYKLADGVFNTKWHLRYFVFDGHSKELTYFKTEKDKKSRGHFKLAGATLTEISTVKGKEHAFIVSNKSGSKKIYLAGHSLEEAEVWRNIILRISDESNKDPFLKLKKLDSLKMAQSTLSHDRGSFVSEGSHSSVIVQTPGVSATNAFVENKKFIRINEEIVEDDRRNIDDEEQCVGDGNYIEDNLKDKELSPEFKDIAKKYQTLLLNDKARWTVLKYVKDLKISGSEYTPGDRKFSFKKWTVLILPMVTVMLVFFLTKLLLIDLPIFALIALLPLVFKYKKGQMIISKPRKVKMLRGVTTMSSSSSAIANYITDVKVRKTYDSMHLNLAHAADEESNGESFI